MDQKIHVYKQSVMFTQALNSSDVISILCVCYKGYKAINLYVKHPLKINMTMENHHVLVWDTSSNCCCFQRHLSFRGGGGAYPPRKGHGPPDQLQAVETCGRLEAKSKTNGSMCMSFLFGNSEDVQPTVGLVRGQLYRIINICYIYICNYFYIHNSNQTHPNKNIATPILRMFLCFCFWQRTGRHGTIKSVSNEYGSSEPPIPRTSSSSGRRILGSKTKSLRCAIATAASWGMEGRQMEWSSKII